MVNHIAFIMDGNGRWATDRNLARMDGHAAGYDVIEPLIKHAIESDIKEVTLFAMSHENFLHRPKQEIDFLLSLFCRAVEEQCQKLRAEGVDLNVIGHMEPMPANVKDALTKLNAMRPDKTKITVNLAINYSGQWHIENIAKQWAAQKSEASFTEMMDASMTPIDILVRTGKETRISNSFLWHISYAECFFPKIFWPDFNNDTFDDILQDYRTRQRRYGRTPCQILSKES